MQVPESDTNAAAMPSCLRPCHPCVGISVELQSRYFVKCAPGATCGIHAFALAAHLVDCGHLGQRGASATLSGLSKMPTLTKCLLGTVLLGVLALQPVQAQTGSRGSEIAGWRSFLVPDFGTKIDFPTGIFSVPEGKPEAGVGERFSTADGRAMLSIYSRANEAGETPSTYLRNNLRFPRSALDYERVTRSFFAISAVGDGNIYYSRCNFSLSSGGGAIHCFDLMYPEAEKSAWDQVVTRLSRSLRPLQERP